MGEQVQQVLLGGRLASVQVLESYIGANADHGSISRAG